MIYLDTGCLLKLYYPEPDSARIAALVSGQPIPFLALHELEISNALELKVFRKEAKPTQVRSTRALIDADVLSGVLHRDAIEWEELFHDAAALARDQTRTVGCRSLDILHCAAARRLQVTSFVTTDARQQHLARRIRLHCPVV